MMRCPRCGTESAGQFCPVCGLQLAGTHPNVICPRCGTSHSFARCPGCGLPSPYLQTGRLWFERDIGILLSIIWNISIILVFLLLAINLVSLLFSSVVLIPPGLNSGSLQSWPLFTIFPNLSVIYVITGTYAISIFFLLIFAILFFTYVYYITRDGKDAVRLVSSPLTSILPRLRSKNRLSMVAQLFLATLFFQIIYILFLNLFGVETSSPSLGEEKWITLFGLASASVYEELVSRIVLIGFPMFIGSIILRSLECKKVRQVDSLTITRRGRHIIGSFKYLWGGNVDRKSPRPVIISALILGIFSSLMFSVAHLGWGDWKLLPTFIAGLALCYAFLRGGFFAAVLLHFATNYFSATSLIVEGDIVLEVFLSFLLFIFIILGSGFLIYYFIYFNNLLKETLFGITKPSPVPIQTQQEFQYSSRQSMAQPYDQQYAVRNFLPTLFSTACPHCGWPEAIYVERKLKCTNCGKLR